MTVNVAEQSILDGLMQLVYIIMNFYLFQDHHVNVCKYYMQIKLAANLLLHLKRSVCVSDQSLLIVLHAARNWIVQAQQIANLRSLRLP